MRRFLLAAALALLASACSKSPCQQIGERLCKCTGASSDTCTRDVESQLKSIDPGEENCDRLLGDCNPPSGVDLCEWLLTADGKRACGIAAP